VAEGEEKEGEEKKPKAKKAAKPAAEKVVLVPTPCPPRGDPPGNKFTAISWNIISIRTLVRRLLPSRRQPVPAPHSSSAMKREP